MGPGRGSGTASGVVMLLGVAVAVSGQEVAARGGSYPLPSVGDRVMQRPSGGVDRIYGRVITVGGGAHTGFIRWDRNEGSWIDLLSGTRPIDPEHQLEAEALGLSPPVVRDRSIEYRGYRITWEEPPTPVRAEVGVRFGYVESLEVVDENDALVTLKGGVEVRLGGSSSDIGSGFRGLVLDGPSRERVEFGWSEIARVEFLPAPAAEGAPAGSERLYGTVFDRSGGVYSGAVSWDRDEAFTEDVLDGRDDEGRDREIPFSMIARIERAGRDSARVELIDGTNVRLSGSNDVDGGNRGIDVSDPLLGQVYVPWEELDAVDFRRPPASASDRGATVRRVPYDAFGKVERIRGTVVTEDGREAVGTIRWDNDEEYLWEMVDGTESGVELDIEFSAIASITKLSATGARVLLRDGRSFDLEDSNDVDQLNKGIFVEADDGSVVGVSWSEFSVLRLPEPAGGTGR